MANLSRRWLKKNISIYLKNVREIPNYFYKNLD